MAAPTNSSISSVRRFKIFQNKRAFVPIIETYGYVKGYKMPALVTWENAEKTIIRHQLIGDWTYEEYSKTAAETQALTASVPHTVHVIVDFSQSISYPTRMLAAGQALDRNLPANQGLLCVIKCPPYIQAVFDIMVKLYPKMGQNVYNVETLEEAFDIIRQNEGAE